MSEKKTIRRHAATHHECRYSQALWVFKTMSEGLGVQLHAHAVDHDHHLPGPRPLPMVQVALTMTPTQAREVAAGLLAAADFYDRQTARLSAARAGA